MSEKLFICAGKSETFSFAKNIGIGLVESAIGLSRICEKIKPKYIVFFGSAGAYNMQSTLLDLYVSNRATQIELSFLNGTSYTPLQDQVSGISSKGVSHETLEDPFSLKNDSLNSQDEVLRVLYSLPNAVVNSSSYITQDVNMSKQMYERGIVLENMEFFSVIRVAKEFGISAVGVFCVSNYCNNLAHYDFIKNHNEVKEKLEQLFNSIKSLT